MYIFPPSLILTSLSILRVVLYRHARSLGIAGYGENRRPIGEAFVVGIAGEYDPATLNGQDNVYSHNGNFYRRFRERKGTTSSMSMNTPTIHFTRPMSHVKSFKT